MHPDRFRDKILGRWSSHPDARARRARFAARLAFAPLGILFSAAVATALDLGGTSSLFRNAGRWFDVALGATGVALALLLGSALAARWSAAQLDAREVSETVVDRPRVAWWVVGVTLALGLLGPLLAWLSGPETSRATRTMLQCMAAFPLLGVLVALGAVTKGSQRLGVLGLVAILASLAALLTTLHDLGVLWQRTGMRDAFARLLPDWYTRLERPFLGVVALAPVVLLVGATRRLWVASAPGQAQPSRRGPWWSRLLRWILNPFGKKPAGASAPSTSPRPPAPPPGWLADFLASLGAQNVPVKLATPRASRRLVDPPSVPAAAGGLLHDGVDQATLRRALGVAFGPLRPTYDQVRVLERFDAAWREALGDAAERGVTATTTGTSPDLVVHGVDGSGRTTALLACACFAALARGQQVLYLAADEERAVATLARLRALLAADGLEAYVAPDRLAVGLRYAVDGPRRDVVAPRILVATPVEAERHLYGAEDSAEGGSSRGRELVLATEVVLADDVLSGPSTVRDHLPFLLAKHRLLLDGHGLVPQIVVACARLAPVGARVVGRRFLSEAGASERNVLALDPPPPDEAWAVRLAIKPSPTVLGSLVSWCVGRELRVVVHRPGATRTAREAMARDAGNGTDLVRVVESADDRALARAGPVDVVFVDGERPYVAAAIRRRVGGPQTVFVYVVYLDDPPSTDDRGVVPVLAEASASALALAHLRSVLRFLVLGSPTAEASWTAIGADLVRAPVVQGNSSEAVFHVDEPGQTRLPADALGTYIVPLAAPRQSRPVDVRRRPALEGALVRQSPDGRRVALVGGDGGQDDANSGRRLMWHDPDGAALDAVSDLATVHDLSIEREGERFVRGGGPDAEGRLTARRADPRGGDPRFVVLDLAFTLDDVRVSPVGGGVDHGLQWFTVDRVAGHPWSVEAAVTGLLDDGGVETTLAPLRLRYDARLTVVTLAPKSAAASGAMPQAADALVAAALKGTWNTAPTHDGASSHAPSLGAALEHALDARVPGWREWARSATFILAGDAAQAGRAAWFLIEPWESGRTVSATLDEMLRDPDELQALLESADWFLGRLAKATDPRAWSRRVRHAGRAADGTSADAANARDLLRAVIEVVDRRAGLGR